MSNDNEIGMDGERLFPHWDCPKCDAPNAGVEQCDPRLHVGRRKRVRCDECGAVMVYRGDYGDESDGGPYNFAHITTEDGGFDETCPVSVAEALLDCGTLASFDGIVTHDEAAEYLYTVLEGRAAIVGDALKAAEANAR